MGRDNEASDNDSRRTTKNQELEGGEMKEVVLRQAAGTVCSSQDNKDIILHQKVDKP